MCQRSHDTKGMSVDEERLYKYDTIESEVVDIFIVLLSLCNNLDLNLFNVLGHDPAKELS